MNTDIVARFVEAFRKAGLKVGFYYSLWDRNCPVYDDDARYADFMQAQIRELLTRYGDVVELWFDGGWDKDHPSREWDYRPEWDTDPSIKVGKGERWRWNELYALIHELQPNCLVIQNSSSDRPGLVKYYPVDIRTAEHYDFVWKDKLVKPHTDPAFTTPQGKAVYLPLEYCTTLSPGWFDKGEPYLIHPSPATIADWYNRARQAGGNLLLNVGPTKDGLIREAHREFLVAARRLFRA
jgi:alpha-L-fucosidase